jgi:hypothetical protein
MATTHKQNGPGVYTSGSDFAVNILTKSQWAEYTEEGTEQVVGTSPTNARGARKATETAMYLMRTLN